MYQPIQQDPAVNTAWLTQTPWRPTGHLPASNQGRAMWLRSRHDREGQLAERGLLRSHSLSLGSSPFTFLFLPAWNADVMPGGTGQSWDMKTKATWMDGENRSQESRAPSALGAAHCSSHRLLSSKLPELEKTQPWLLKFLLGRFPIICSHLYS